MRKEEIIRLFNDFLKNYDEETKNIIWKKHSEAFRSFWNDKILNGSIKEISESEVDQVIRILDRNGKGNTKADEAVAKVMIPQGAWRRMFKEIKQHGKLHELLNKIFVENNDGVRDKLIDELYKINEGRKNGLTGKSANAINTMLFAFNPDKYTSVVSLNDRKKVIDSFGFAGGPDFDNDTAGKKITVSNTVILNGFRALGLTAHPRTVAIFLYHSPIKDFWKPGEEHSESFQ
ncbi:MAG: hypothetical protein AB1798_12695, partial [Spirochaetota bacterium]